MLIAILQVILGIALLYFGAEWLVKASASLAVKIGITPFLVGLTIVGFGTSTPELIVSLDAIWTSHTEIATGNIVGSNLFNTAIILGVALLIRPATYSTHFRRFDVPFMLLTCALLWWVGILEQFGRFGGFLFILILFFYTFIATKFSKKDHIEKKEDISFPTWQLKKSLPMLLISFALLSVGSHFFLNGSIKIATFFHISEAVIGLTIVAAGTSLPELATTILASIKKQEDIVMGNIIGSNIFNVLGVLGIMALVKPVSFQGIHFIDYLFMFGVNVIFAFLVLIRPRMGRMAGGVFLLSYIAYTYVVISKLPNI